MPHRAGAHDIPTGNGAQSFQEKLSSPFPISEVADSPQDQKDSGTQLTPEMIAQHEKDREELKKTIGSLLKEDGFSDAEIKSQLEVLVPADDLALEKYPEPPLENTPEVVGKEVENAPPDAGDLPGAEIDPTTDSFPPPPPMPELEAEVK
nr:hypothetical protein [uncultured Desulfobulbus sp.]